MAADSPGWTPATVATLATVGLAQRRLWRREACTTRAVIVDIQRSGVSTLAAIAKVLEARGVRTPAGRSTWQPGAGVEAVGRLGRPVLFR